jgi:RES domain-containing protein
MELHRISKEKYISDLSGEGAKIYGGRWNKPGTAALYTSQHRSLALLELLVHFTSKKALRNHYSFISLEIPEKEIINIGMDEIPHDFHRTNNRELWELTEHYFFKKNVLALKVPSMLVKNEFNVILNPTHAFYTKIKASKPEAAFLDERYANLL